MSGSFMTRLRPPLTARTSFPATLRPWARDILALLGALCSFGLSSEASSAEPRYEKAPCTFEGAAELASGVECGTLFVPEVRELPGSRMLKISVAVLEATAPGAAPDPVVYLSGGPGQAAISEVAAWRSHPFMRSRDLILVDQRGTGASEPLCPELQDDLMRTFARDLTPAQDISENQESARKCLTSLQERGVDPDAYDSKNTAADLEDLRRLLGIETWNLLGVSYGTRLAFASMRHFPGGIRSVILDSAYPPGEDLAEGLDLEPAIERLSADCAASPQCKALGGDPRGDLQALVSQAEGSPLHTRVSGLEAVPEGDFIVNAQDVRFLFEYFVPYSVIRPLMPAFLGAWRQGRTESMAPLWRIAGLHVDIGKFYAVQCRENLPSSDMSQRGAGSGVAFFDALSAVCAVWKPQSLDPQENEPVESPIPALFFSGDLDFRAPRAWARRALEHLPNGVLVEVPGVGHGALDPECTGNVAAAFLDHPDLRPDTSCLQGRLSPAPLGALHLSSGVRWLVAGLPETQPGPLALCATLVGMLSWLLAWPIAALLRWRRRRRAGAGLDLPLAATFAGLNLVAVLSWVFMLLLGQSIMSLMSGPYMLAMVAGLPMSDQSLFLLPKAIALLLVTCLIAVVLLWRRASWTRLARVHFVFTWSAAAVFVLILVANELF